MRVIRDFRIALLEQQGHLFHWVPVCFGGGIGVYFLLRFEPALGSLALAGCATFLLGMLARGREADFGACLWALALGLAGFSWAGARTHFVSAPVLEFRYYGPVEGRVVALDRSSSDAVRITLDHVVLERVSPVRTPKRVRVSLHSTERGSQPVPGMLVGLTAHLSPPSGPVEPGGFDFQRHAWFQRLGAIGYSRTPLVHLQPKPDNMPVLALRMRLSSAIQDRMPAEVAGFAAAVTTGDRSSIPFEVLEALRISNLAHLLAISGLHMGLLAAFVFGGVRTGVALVPALAVRVNGKKAAAVVALVASAGYLMLSGGSVSTQRAFVMTSVMLTAVLLDRRALSLRAVAVAACIVLALRPESLFSPGFQMSFSATTALVAVFGALREKEVDLGPKWLRPVSAVFVSSLVAGLATAPFAAMHFNHLAHYGLPANLLSVPIMGTVVVPSAVVAGVLSPLGLEAAPLWLMGKGLAWIQGVATYFSSLAGARSFVVSPSIWVMPIMVAGSLWLVLWRRNSRWLGVVIIICAFGLWGQTKRPDVLIAQSGGLVGITSEKGRALSKPRGDGFVARAWLENDGLLPDQEYAASLWKGSVKGIRSADLQGGGSLTHISGKRALSTFVGCETDDIVVMSTTRENEWPCRIFDPEKLAQIGAVAIRFANGRTQIISARDLSGQRLWHRALPENDQ